MVDKNNEASSRGTAGGTAIGGGTQMFDTEACWSDSSGDLLVLNTGDWRTEHPTFDKDKCNACGFCYIFCPVQCIVDDEDGIHYAADLDYCKGCGICARECPKDAITMTPEDAYAEECKVE